MKMDSDTAKKKASVGISIWIVLGLIVLVWGAYWAWIAPGIKENQFDPLTALFSGGPAIVVNRPVHLYARLVEEEIG